METIPLSAGQRSLWFVDQLTPGTIAHNVVHGSWILEDLDVDLLREAFQQVVNRHPCLRSIFKEVDGQPVQTILDSAPLAFESSDISTLSEGAVQKTIAQHVYRPFDIEHGPLMRLVLLTRAPKEHIILLSFHHLAVDLWSIALIIDEGTRLYAAYRRGEALHLPPPAHTYEEFVRAQNDMVNGERGEALWRFWQEYLGGDLSVLDLPTDHPRPRSQTHRGSTETCRLSSRLRASLKDLGRQHGATLFSTVLAAYYALLHRYTGQEDILIGTPKANRQRSSLDVVGYFVNPIVLRARVSGDMSFSRLLRDLHSSVERAFQHDAYPFGSLVERIHPLRDPSRFPLFQVMFSWQKTIGVVQGHSMTALALGEHKQEMQVNGVHLASLAMPDLAVPYDLTLMAAEASDGELAITLEYNTALYTRTTARRLLRHLKILLKTVVVFPERTISALPLMTLEERQQVTLWSGVPTASPDHDSLAHMDIAAVARRQPSATAVIERDHSYSYADLMGDAQALCTRLHRAGVEASSVVAFYGDQSYAQVVSLLGILLAGGTYLPIDPGYPHERVQFMVKDAGVKVILAPPERSLAAAGFGVRVVSVLFGQADDGNPPVATHLVPSGLPAYVMYTSGSTGRPKGVCIDYAGLSRHCRTAARHYDLQPDDRVLQFTALSFDPSIEQVLTTLLAGATLVIREGELWPADSLHERISTQEISVINIPPSYWQEVATVWTAAPSLLRHTPLRLIIIGGDVLPPDTLALWTNGPLRRVRLLNAYGPTETTITALTHEVSADLPQIMQRACVPIGTPLPGRRAFVLDSYGNPVAPGIPGILHLGGVGLAMGYLHDPALTAAKFRPDAWSGEAGHRVYDTGDRVRYREDGALEFLGRRDHQIKIRGFRVELEEITHCARSHPAVRDAITLVHRNSYGDGQLLLYVTTRDDDSVMPGALREFLRKHMPPFMVPARITFLQEFPRTAGGKIDRQALPAPTEDRLNTGTPLVEPRTGLEEFIASEVALLLNVDKVGVHDNFFDLGGHSLLASRLVSSLRKHFRIDLSLRELFEAPTVADLATTISRSAAEHGHPDNVARIISTLTSMSEEDARALLALRTRNIGRHER
jgi:amino acid adenylation domain-containing protein